MILRLYFWDIRKYNTQTYNWNIRSIFLGQENLTLNRITEIEGVIDKCDNPVN